MFARRRASSFPFFTLCTATDAVKYMVLTYVGYHNDRLYHKLVWPLHFVQVAVSLLMAFELCRHVFCPTGVWASDVRKPLIRMVSIATLIAFAIAFLSYPAVGPHSMLLWRLNFFHGVLETIFYVGMLVLSSVAGLPWKTHAARIAQAMCAGYLFDLTLDIVTSSLPRASLNHGYFLLHCIAALWDAAIMTYWLFTLWPDEPAPQPLPDHMHKQIYTLQQQAEDGLIKIRSWKST